MSTEAARAALPVSMYMPRPTPKVMGTRRSARASLRFCPPDLLRRDFSRNLEMRAMLVSDPTAPASIFNLPSSMTPPESTSSPTFTCRGADSPVMDPAFTEASPSITRPSTGIISPEPQTTTSPRAAWS